MKKFLQSVFVMLFVSVMAQAGITSFLSEGFEDAATLPAGWTMEYVAMPIASTYDTTLNQWKVETQTLTDTLRYPDFAAEGMRRVAARNNTSDEMRFVTRLVSPMVQMTGAFQPQLLFSHAEVPYRGYSDTLRVYYRKKTTDAWTPFAGGTYQNNKNWKQEVLALGTGSTYQFAFEITENMGHGVVLDDIIVRSTPTCMNVTNVTASSIHAYDAFLGWDQEGSSNYFQVMVSKSPITDFNNIDSTQLVAYVPMVYRSEYTVSGLTPETTYYVYVRSDCEENESGFTDWAAGQFRTLVVAYLPYTATFEDALPITGNTGFAMPKGWTLSSNAGTNIPYVHYANVAASRQMFSVDSTRYLAFSGELTDVAAPIPVGKYAYAATPELTDTVQALNLQALEVNFWATAAKFISSGNTEYAAQLYVGVMTDPNDLSTFTMVDSVKILSSYTFRHFHVSLAGYTGNGKYVALLSRADRQNAFFVDNLHIARVNTPTPSHVKVSATNVLGFTVSADMHGADSWNLRVNDQLTSGLTGSSYVLAKADSSLMGQTVRVSVQAVKAGVAGEWTQPVVVRVPTALGALPRTIGFEPTAGTVALSGLACDVHAAIATVGAQEVFFPVRSMEQNNNSYPRLMSSSPNYSGAHCQICGIDNWFCLPEAENLAETKMVFRYATITGSSAAFEVGVMTDPYDLSTFTSIASYTTSTASYLRGVISFDTYTGTGKYIAFRTLDAGAGAAASVNLIDEIVLSQLDNCREATNIVVAEHSDYATVSWNGSGMTGWIVGFGQSRSMMNATYTTVNQPTITFDNLEQEETYYFTISTICDNDTLRAEEVYTFTTPMGLPVVQDFPVSGVPEGWSRASVLASTIFNGAKLEDYIVSSSSSGWTIGRSSDYNIQPVSSNYAYQNIFGTSCRYWLISPVLNLGESDGSPIELSFDLGVKAWSADVECGPDDQFMVLVSVDGGNTWQRTNAFVWNNDGTGDYVLNDLIWDTWNHISLDFSRFGGKKIQFAFYDESTVSNKDNRLLIDNISLRVTDPACGGLSNLRAIGTSGTDAQITWQLAGVNPHPALIQISKESTFKTIVRTDTVQGTSLSLTGLESSTRYYVRARQLCDNDNNYKTVNFRTMCEAVSPVDFGVETFDSESSLLCWSDGFITNNGSTAVAAERVKIDNFGYVLELAKASTDSTANDGAYAISPEFDIEDPITNYEVIFSAGSPSTVKTNVHRLAVGVVTNPSDAGYTWQQVAQVNLNLVEDSTEMKTYAVSFADYMGDWDGNFGKHVMFMAEAGSDSTDFIYIDNVSLVPAGTCRQVLDMEADSMTSSSARLHWSNTAENYELLVSKKAVRPDTCTNAFIHTFTTDTIFHVANLDARSTYYAYVRAICGEGDTARWSGASIIKTGIGVPYLEVFHANSIADKEWTIKSGLFSGNVVKGSALSSASDWYIRDVSNLSYAPSSIKGISKYAMRVNAWGSSTKAWMISQTLDLTTPDDALLTLSAKVARCTYSSSYSSSDVSAPGSSTDDRFILMISEDEGATWTRENALVYASDGSGDGDFNTLGLTAKKLSMDISHLAGKKVKIACYAESTVSGTDVFLYVDSVRIEKKSAICAGVTRLKAECFGMDSARLNWHVTGTPKDVLVEISRDRDFTAGSVDSVYTAADSLLVGGLEINATYYFRVSQQECSSAPATTSVRTPFALPYTEAFLGTSLSSDWTLLQGDANLILAADSFPSPATNSGSWNVGTTKFGMTNSHLYGAIMALTAQQQQWVVSPLIYLNAADDANLQMQFEAGLTNHITDNPTPANPKPTTGQEFRVLVSADGGNTWTADRQWIFSDAADAYAPLDTLPVEGIKISLDMKPYIGKSVRVAFYKATTNTLYSNDIHIANLQIREVGEACDVPTDLTADSVSFTLARLTWNGSDEAKTVFQYSEDAGFANAKTDTAQSGLSHVLTGLKTNTTYYVRIQQICGENSISDYTEPISFTTLLGLPFVHTFNTTPFTSTADTWLNCKGMYDDVLAGKTLPVQLTTGGWKYDAQYTAILGEPHVYCTASTSNEYWLISPEIDLTPNSTSENIVLQWDMALTNTFKVGTAPTRDLSAHALDLIISTDGGQTWSATNQWEWSSKAGAYAPFVDIPAGLGGTYQLNLSRFGGQKITLAFVLRKASSVALSINNVSLISLASVCFGVSNFTTISAIDTAVVGVLSAADEADRWELAYGRQTDSIADMQHMFSNSDTVRLTGLTLDTEYYVYARSICGFGDSSKWCGPYLFSTPRGIPYSEPMESGVGPWKRYVANPDSVFVGRAVPTATTSASCWVHTTAETPLNMPHIYATTSTNTSYWLVSDSINLMPQTGDKGIYLSWRMSLTSAATSKTAPFSAKGHRFIVAVSEDNGLTWSGENAFVWGDSTDYALYENIPAGEGKDFHLNLARFAGKSIRLAFIKAAAANGTSCINVANISLEEFAQPCFGVAKATATTAGRVATVVIEPDTMATEYQYALVLRGAPLTSVIPVTETTPNFQITNLVMSTKYDLYLRELCGVEDTSAWYGPVQFATPYGVPYQDNMYWSSIDEDWSTYSGRLTNLTSSTSGWTITSSGVGFTNPHPNVSLYSSGRYLLVSPELDLSEIDHRRINLSFDLAMTGYSSTPSTELAGRSFEVVVSADGGKTWMEDRELTWDASSGSFRYAEIPVDGANYTVDLSEYAGSKIRLGFYAVNTSSTSGSNYLHICNIAVDTLSGSYCSHVKRVQFSEQAYQSVKVQLFAPFIQYAQNLQYLYVREGALFDDRLAVSTDTAIFKLSGLQSSMSYDFYARMQCEDGAWSDWNGPFTFSTLECGGPTGVSFENLTLQGGTLHIEGPNASAALAYEYYITTKGGVNNPSAATRINTNVAKFAYNFQGNQEYDIYVRKFCTDVDVSEWSEPFTFKAPYVVPFADAMDWTSIETGWTAYSGRTLNSMTPASASASYGWQTGRAGYGFDPSHLFCYGYQSTSEDSHYMLVSPTIDLSNLPGDAKLQLELDLALTGYYSNSSPYSFNGHAFYVLVNTGDGWKTKQGFSWLASNGDFVYKDIPTDGESYTLDLSSYVGSSIQLGLYKVSTSTYNNYTNEIHVMNFALDTLDRSANCPGVDSLLLTRNGANSAEFRIVYRTVEGKSVVDTAFIEISTDPDFNTILASDTVYGNTYTVNGLTPTTRYYARAMQLCADGETSRYSKTVNFTSARGLRFYSDFSQTLSSTGWMGATSTRAKTLFDGARMTSRNTSPSWSQTSANCSFPTQSIRYNVYSSNRYAWAITPEIDLSVNPGEAIFLEFDALLTLYNYSNPCDPTTVEAPDDQFMILVSLDGGDTWLRENAIIWNNETKSSTSYYGPGDYGLYSELNGTMKHYRFDFSKYANQSVTVAIYAESEIANADNYMWVDNFDLHKSAVYNIADSICQGTTYMDYGFNIETTNLSAGVHTYDRISADNDSIINLSLMVKAAVNEVFTDTICEGEHYVAHGFDLYPTRSDRYRRFVDLDNGCVATTFVDLTVYPVERTQAHVYACNGGSFTFGGKTYYNSGAAYDTVPSSHGCDSIITYFMHFSRESSYETEYRIALCDGDTYNVGDHIYSQPGMYVDTMTAIGGCDSIQTTYLLHADNNGVVYDTVSVLDLPYVYDNRVIVSVSAKASDEPYHSIINTTCGTGDIYVLVVDQPEGFNDLFSGEHRIYKRIIDNQLFIIVDDRWYDATGKAVKKRE